MASPLFICVSTLLYCLVMVSGQTTTSDPTLKVISVGIAIGSTSTDLTNELRSMVADADYAPYVGLLNYDDWCYSFDFSAYRDQATGMTEFFVGQSWDPHRMIVRNTLDELNQDGWDLRSSFWGYTEQNQDNDLIPIYIGEVVDSVGQRSFISLTPLDSYVWPKQNVFFVASYHIPEPSTTLVNLCPSPVPSNRQCVLLMSSFDPFATPLDGQCFIAAHGSAQLTLAYAGQKVFMATGADGSTSPFFDDVATLTVDSPNAASQLGANFRGMSSGDPNDPELCDYSGFPEYQLPGYGFGYGSLLPGNAVDISNLFSGSGTFRLDFTLRSAYGDTYSTDVFVCTYT